MKEYKAVANGKISAFEVTFHNGNHGYNYNLKGMSVTDLDPPVRKL